MRYILLLACVMGVSVSGLASASAKDASTCKVKTNDIGTIVGHGRDPAAAFEDAATQCFDRYSMLHSAKKNNRVDEETGTVWIDTCANIKCG